MAIKQRVSKMEERIGSADECTEFRTETVHVPGGITRAEQGVFMDRYGDRPEDPQVAFWRIFVVGMPTDHPSFRPGGISA
jgi:hypothetical protein